MLMNSLIRILEIVATVDVRVLALLVIAAAIGAVVMIALGATNSPP